MFVAFGLILVIALFTALIGPYFVEWSAYKRDFEAQAARIIGQDVTVDGEAQVRLLPQPSITFTELAVGQNQDGSPMLVAERFSANVELMPFLSGEVRIVDMTLVRPKFNFRIDETGQIAWTDRQQLLVDPGQVKLDKLTIVEGAFEIDGLASGEPLAGSQINANVSAQSLYGPWRLTGEGEVDGKHTDFQIATGTLADDNSLRLKLAASRTDQPYDLEIDGPVKLKDGVLSWSGKFSVRPDAGNRANSIVNRNAEPLPVRTEGSFELTPTNVAIPDYRMEIGRVEDPFVVTGKGHATFKGGVKFKLEVDGRQIDVDRLNNSENANDQEAGAAPHGLESRIALLRGILDQIPIPAFNGEVDLEIPAIIVGNTYIRQVSALIKPFGKGWEITRLSSAFPGNTLVEASGRLGRGQEFGFDGKLLVASRQPTGFAAWAVGKVDPVIRQLPFAGLSATISLSDSQTSLEQLELVLGANKLTGSINRLSPTDENGRPALITRLEGEAIRLADLRALAALVVGGEGAEVDSLAFSHDLDVTIKADRFSGFGVEAKGIDTSFLFQSGELSVSRFLAEDLFGVEVESAGQIKSLRSAPEGNLKLSLKASSFTRLAAYLLETVDSNSGFEPVLRAIKSDPYLSADSVLSVELDARTSSLATNDDKDGEEQNTPHSSRTRLLIDGTIGTSTVQIRSGLKGVLADLQNGSGSTDETPWIDLSAEISNEAPSPLAKQIGLAELGFNDAAGLVEGPLSIVLESAGDSQKGFSTILTGKLPNTVLSAKGLIGGSEQLATNAANDGEEFKNSFDFDITLGSEDFSPLLTSFGFVVPGLNGLLGEVAPLSISSNLKNIPDSKLGLIIKKGLVSGNGFKGELSFDPAPDSVADGVKIDGKLDFDYVSLPWLSGTLTGYDVDSAALSGFATLNDDVFTGPVIPSVEGTVELTAKRVEAGIGAEGTNGAMMLDINTGKIDLTGASMDWRGGRLSGDLTVSQVEGTLALTGQYYGEKLPAPALLEAVSAPSVLGGQLTVSGTIEGSGKSPAALSASLAGSGVMELADGILQGIQTDGLQLLLDKADEEGFEVDTSEIAALAQQAFLEGRIAFEPVSIPYSFREGEMRLRNIQLPELGQNSSRAPSLDMTYSLITGEADAGLTIRPDPGIEAIDGASTEVGFLWQGVLPRLEMQTDTAALEGFLALRAFEAEQRRVELLQASILEKQRFRRELLKSGERGRWLQAKRAEEIKRQEEARLQREAEKRAAAIEAARLEAERKKRQEEAERLKQEAAERQAKEEADRLARENAETSGRNDNSTEKQGFDIAPLPKPQGAPNPSAPKAGAPQDLFKNIEKLLTPSIQ